MHCQPRSCLITAVQCPMLLPGTSSKRNPPMTRLFDGRLLPWPTNLYITSFDVVITKLLTVFTNAGIASFGVALHAGQNCAVTKLAPDFSIQSQSRKLLNAVFPLTVSFASLVNLHAAAKRAVIAALQHSSLRYSTFCEAPVVVVVCVCVCVVGYSRYATWP